MDAYLDGKPMQSSVVFETEGDAIVAYDTQTPEDRWDIVFTDAEHFQLTNGHNSTMEFSILYPVIGTWSLVYALDVDGSFLSNKQIFDAFGSNDIAIVIEEEGVGYVAMDGEAQTEPETVSMQAGGTLLLGDDPLKIDISRNILGMDIETEYGTLLFMFARSTPVVIPK